MMRDHQCPGGKRHQLPGEQEDEDVVGQGNQGHAGEEHRRVNVDFPAWMIAELDREATRLGVTRQSLIKVWIAEKIDQGDHPAA